jgi:hypothetical protein
MPSGISRSGAVAHHSSTTKSLYACTHASASSLSLNSRNRMPANRVYVGKHNEAHTPSMSMSFRRSFGS